MRSTLSMIQKKPFDLNMYPIPVARYAAAHFMYAYITNDKKEYDKWIKKSTTDLVQYYHAGNEKSTFFPGYYIKMIEFLLLAKEFEHAKNLIEIQDEITIPKNYVYGVHVSYTEVLKLHNIVVATFMNNKLQANKLLKDFQIDKIWIFDKKYYTMWYFIVQYSLTDSVNKKVKFKAQLDALVAETKFSYFGRLFEELHRG